MEQAVRDWLTEAAPGAVGFVVWSMLCSLVGLAAAFVVVVRNGPGATPKTFLGWAGTVGGVLWLVGVIGYVVLRAIAAGYGVASTRDAG